MKERSESYAGLGLPKMLLDVDFFPAPTPQFNSKGEEAVRTYFGGLFSLLSLSLFFLFAVTKFGHLMTRHNPLIVEYEEAFALDATDEYNLGEDKDFMVAVGLVHYISGEPLNDPRYVKWIDLYYAVDDGVSGHKQANPLHPCTEEDYKKFNPPDKSAESAVEQLKKGGALFCLDEEILKT